MNAVITGAEGFLGWHLSCRMRSTRGMEPKRLSRTGFASSALSESLTSADTVFHLAGVNRAASDGEVEQGNVALASRLSDAVRQSGRPVHLVYANSVHARGDSPYGRGKAAAANLLREASASVGGTFADVLLPNLFGEHGRPGYNSFVSTFAHQVAHGDQPSVSGDREIWLLHAQGAAEVLLRAAESRVSDVVEPTGEPHSISEVASRLQGYASLYDRGEIPDLSEVFDRDLFNTYRSYVPQDRLPFYADVHADQRGWLCETLRVHGGTGQSFVSTTEPGETRGDHYHLHKVERFFVVEGDAEIAMRRLYSHDVITYRINGARPGAVDMPTMWVHNIKNVGTSRLITVFWADQLLNPESPDQYAEQTWLHEELR